jgi:hypothetical protein
MATTARRPYWTISYIGTTGVLRTDVMMWPRPLSNQVTSRQIRNAVPETTDGLVNDDLLGLWGEKKVQDAAELLEAKGYAQSRFNPKNRYDRTKQYRLIPERLAADL